MFLQSGFASLANVPRQDVHVEETSQICLTTKGALESVRQNPEKTSKLMALYKDTTCDKISKL